MAYLFPSKLVLQECRTLFISRGNRKPIISVRLPDTEFARDSVLISRQDGIFLEIINLFVVGIGSQPRGWHGIGRQLHRTAECRLHCGGFLGSQMWEYFAVERNISD
jgi:hypothetical protein